METYLDAADLGAGTAVADLDSPAAYYASAARGRGDPAAVAQRGRAAGAALGADPLGAVRDLGDRVLARVAATGDDAVVATPVGGMRLVDYLPTRVLELTVHGCDLATALDEQAEPPAPATAVTIAVLAELAGAAQCSADVLRALTGRGGWGPGRSLLPL